VVSNTTTGTYVFTPAAGQCANPTPISLVIRVNPLPTAAQMNVHSNSPVCAGTTLNLYANGGVEYEWAGPNNYSVTFQNPVRNNATVAMTGDYTVTVTTGSGCISTATIPVLVNPLPTATASSNSPICIGGSLALNSSVGLSYSWSGPSNYSSNSQNPIINPVTALSAGIYHVTVTSAEGCTSTAQTMVTINPLPTATASNNGPLCAGATLNLTSGGGTGYSWSGPTPFTSVAQNPTITSVTTANSGTYTVTVTNAAGCTSTAQTTVVVNNNPTPNITGDTNICLGESTTLTANGGATYLWQTGGGSSITVSPDTATIYQVIATTAQGCTGTTSITVNVSHLIMTAINSVSDTCSESNGSITISVGNGIGAYTYQWSNSGSTGNTLNGLSTGDYIVTVTDGAGCQLVQSINVGNFPLPILSIASSTDDHCSLGIGSATVLASGGTGNYYYQWNTNPVQNGASASNLISGSYVVQVNDEHCSNSIVVNVGNISGPTASANHHVNQNGTVSFIDLSTGASNWNWNFGEGSSSTNQNPIYQYPEDGDYSVVLLVTDDFGCIDSTTISFTINGDMDIWIPSSFTPNGDGINDVFKPSGNGYSLDGYQMVIYNRWGQQVFISTQFDKGWDGRVKGEELDINAVFTYRILIRDILGKDHVYVGRVTTLGSETFGN
jgi:gliding motility-associated-like protein